MKSSFQERIMPRKVLIITYYWPPSGGAGVQRWLKFVKYLRKFDWEPIVYTPSNPEYPAIDETLVAEIPEGISVLKTPIWEPYNIYKKLSGKSKEEKVNASGFISEKKSPGILKSFSIWLRGNFFIPDARKFWIKPSEKFLVEWLKNNKVDAIVSTGPPHSMHMIALEVHKKTNIPWLADFRDPWTTIDFYDELRLTRLADRKHHKMELQVLTMANEVVVIGESMKEGLLKIKHRDYKVITNGFDIEASQQIPVETDEKFTIAHIGSMAKSRNPENLWKALAELKSRTLEFSNDLEIKLIGSVDFSVTESIQSHGLSDNLTKIDYQPHDQIILYQRKARVLLLIINDTPNAKVILPGKFFEYMASGRPILCIGPMDGDAAKVINETGAGLVADVNSQEDILQKLTLMYQNYKQKIDVIAPSGIARYSREELTRQLAEILNSL